MGLDDVASLMRSNLPDGLTPLVRVSNTTGAAVDLWIEPLGDRVVLPTDDTFEIMAASDQQHEVEIEFRESSVVVHGWIKQVNSVSASGNRTLVWP
jgi:hypothetical protein